jgi:hypothetical protein
MVWHNDPLRPVSDLALPAEVPVYGVDWTTPWVDPGLGGPGGPVTPQALAPNGTPVADITQDPGTAGAADQAAIEDAAAEGLIPITPWWMTDSFFTALLFLAGGYGAAWFARKQRWV